MRECQKKAMYCTTDDTDDSLEYNCRCENSMYIPDNAMEGRGIKSYRGWRSERSLLIRINKEMCKNCTKKY